MTNPYRPAPQATASTDAPHASTDRPRPGSAVGGLGYILLLPLSAVYTLLARELAGPGYTTAPNQGAMVVFFLAAIAWPVVAVVCAVVIRFAFGARGIPAGLIGLVSWLLSCLIPFAIGMK